MIDFARSIASCALLRCSSTTASAASLVAERDCDVDLQLCEPVTRFFERQDVLLRVDRADQIVCRRVELAAAHVVARGQERHLILGRLNRAVGLDLHDLLLGLGQFRLRLPQRKLLVGRIDLENDFALLDRSAGGHELDQAQRAAGRRGTPVTPSGPRAIRRSHTR